jgi:hypothetical protein
MIDDWNTYWSEDRRFVLKVVWIMDHEIRLLGLPGYLYFNTDDPHHTAHEK